MRFQVGVGLLLTTLIASAGAHEGHHHYEHSSAEHVHHHDHGAHPPHDHNDLRPHTHIAYHHVTSACAADVELLCQEEQKMEQQQNQLPQTMGDPFLDWVLLPQAPPPPEMEDMARVMDHVMNSFFSAPSTQFTYIYLFEEPEQTPHFVMDSMAAKLATETEPEEIPELAHTLQKYGKQLMEKHDVDTFHHHMARRLTEMDATTIQHHVHLPFGCPKNRCLMQAMKDKKLSAECDHSIQQLETTYQLEEELELRQEMFLDMMWLYITVLFVLLVLLTRKYRAHRAERILRIRILQAVYSNPSIKSQIEAELGGSVGSVPPLPPHALRLMSSGGKDLKRRLRCMKRVHLSFFLVLLVLVFVAPFWVLPICILISVSRVVQLCLVSSVKDRECECCCCGASTTDAASGNLTETQECCGCCKGTGVCAPSCAACCGSNACCCGCCDSSCNCCSKTKKAADDCTCCCCGATVEQAKAGTLSEDQVCCNCCKGTGTCDPSCASCCTAGGCGCCCCCCGATEKAAKEGVLSQAQACCSCCNGTGCCSCCSCCAPQKKGRGQKHVFASKYAVYQGVPLQVV